MGISGGFCRALTGEKSVYGLREYPRFLKFPNPKPRKT